jgi:hypothetical protein
VRALAKVLRRVLPLIEEPELRRAAEQVVGLAEMGLGLKVSVQEAGRNDWYKAVAPGATARPELELPVGAVHRPR